MSSVLMKLLRAKYGADVRKCVETNVANFASFTSL